MTMARPMIRRGVTTLPRALTRTMLSLAVVREARNGSDNKTSLKDT